VYTLAPNPALVRTLGSVGSGTAVGSPAQIGGNPRLICWLPFTNTSILLDDAGNNRVIEVNVLTGNLVKVWAGRGGVSLAASMTLVAIGYGTTVDLYNIAGTFSRTLTSSISDPWGLRFAPDGSYLTMVEKGVTPSTMKKFRVSDGAVQTAPVTFNGSSLDVAEECVSSTTGNIAAVLVNDGASNVTLVDGGTTTVWQGGLNRVLDMALVPSLGVLLADFSNNRVLLLSSVTILTHPANVTVPVGSVATFTVALTATSATSGVTYTWTKGGVAVGTNSSTYSFTPSATDAGIVSTVVVTVTHAMGSAVSSTAYLTVQVRFSGRGACC
jgi:hypothetical protein